MPVKGTPPDIEESLKDDSIPKIYMNNFQIAVGTGDVVILAQNGPKRVGVVNLSYTIAKTLSIKLQGLIRHLEKQTGNTIMTTDDINKALERSKDVTIQ